MTFKGDIHQTRVKNSSSGDPNFSVPARAIWFIFLLLKRARQNAGHAEALFYNSYYLCEKKVTS